MIEDDGLMRVLQSVRLVAIDTLEHARHLEVPDILDTWTFGHAGTVRHVRQV